MQSTRRRRRVSAPVTLGKHYYRLHKTSILVRYLRCQLQLYEKARNPYYCDSSV